MSNAQERRNRQQVTQEAALRRAEQDKKQHAGRVMAFTGLGLALAMLGVVIAYILSQDTSPAKFAAAPNSDAPPAVVTEDGGITVGQAGELGSTNLDAPVVSVYYDYLCPACGMFEATNSADLEQLVADGTITLAYHPVAILDAAASGTSYSTRAAVAALTVADLAPDKFVEFHDQLFADQPAENTKFDAEKFLMDAATNVGIPAEVSSRFSEGLYGQWVKDSTQEATRNGLSGTPTIRIDGEVLDPSVNWASPGALRAYLEGL